MKTAAAFATVVTIVLFSVSNVNAAPTVTTERVAYCQELLAQATEQCKSLAAGAEECFLDAVMSADHCTRTTGKMANAQKDGDTLADIAIN